METIENILSLCPYVALSCIRIYHRLHIESKAKIKNSQGSSQGAQKQGRLNSLKSNLEQGGVEQKIGAKL